MKATKRVVVLKPLLSLNWSAERWAINRAAAATVAGLAGIAGGISYSHMRQLAAAHGDTGWRTQAFSTSDLVRCTSTTKSSFYAEPRIMPNLMVKVLVSVVAPVRCSA